MGWLTDKIHQVGKLDPLAHKLVTGVFKQDSKNVRGFVKTVGWSGLEKEADNNVNDPERGLGRAATATALAAGALYAGAAGAGAGAGEAGAGAGAAGGATAGGGAVGAAADFGAGTYAAGEGASAAPAYMGVGSTPASGAGAGYSTPSSGGFNWMKFAQQGMKGMGQQMGGGGGGNADIAHQMRLAELLRQQREYDAQTEAGMKRPPVNFEGGYSA